MSYYYASTLIGDGTPADPYRPPTDAPFSLIDFTPTNAAERVAVVAVDSPQSDRRMRKLSDGDTTEKNRATSSTLSKLLKPARSLDRSESLAGALARLLILDGSHVDSNRWNPLRATHRGRHEIRLGDRILYAAPAPTLAAYADDFERATSDDLGSDWSEEFGGWQIEFDRAITVNVYNTECLAHWTQLMSTDDHIVSGVWHSGQGNRFKALAPIARGAESALTFYMMRNSHQSNWAPNRINFTAKQVAGVQTLLSSSPENTVIPNLTTISIRVDGSSIVGLLDDTEEHTTTDTSIPSGRHVGVYGYHTHGDDRARFEEWSAADLSGVLENPIAAPGELLSAGGS